jgi:hypothetical protein
VSNQPAQVLRWRGAELAVTVNLVACSSQLAAEKQAPGCEMGAEAA